MSKSLCKPNARGFTLVEMVAIITLTATLSGTIIVSLAGLFRYNQTMHQRHDAEFALRQLTTAIRSDIHHATQCHWDQQQQTLQVSLPSGERVSYRAEQNRWQRTLADADGKEQATGYGLDESFHCQCEQQIVASGELLRLALSNGPLASDPAATLEHRPVRLDLVAQVGRDLFSLEGIEP